MMRPRPPFFLAAAISLLVHGVGIGGGVWLGKHARDARDHVKAPTFVGETFEIAHEGDDSEPVVTPEIVPVDTDREPQGMLKPTARALPRVGAGRTTPVEVPLTYGALGDRSASSVIITVSRGFPQAASTDPIWRTAPFGDAGSATMDVELNEDGTVARWSLGPGASQALRQAMVRTMGLVGGRTFVARGAVTHLHVAARVTADAVRDGDDAVYALHSDHEGETAASAYFSLTSGRRVEITLTLSK
jgi:hypothetical protein